MSNIIPFDEKIKLAEAFAKSKLFGITDANQVLALMAVCEAEGIHPAKAVQEYHVIQGRPALKADAMLARFQNAGGQVEWKEYTDDRVTGIFRHPLGSHLEVTWTIEQATRIGLVKPGSGWQKFPRAMLRSRCISEGIRSVFPGSVTGFYSPEEVQDFEPRDITPRKDTQELTVTPVVEAVSILDMEEDDIPVDETDTLDLYIPGQQSPYARYFDEHEFMAGYAEIFVKIQASTKYTDAEKETKIKDFKEVNKKVMSSWDSVRVAQLLALINRLKRESK